jgi:selenocysteine lyase/cysteine desulfurase
MRTDIARAMQAILAYERGLTLEMLKVLHESKGARPRHRRPRPDRPTACRHWRSTSKGIEPAAVTEAMARAQIGIRDGHMYSPRLMRRLGLPEASGTVRVSLVHYNTVAEDSAVRQLCCPI